MAMTKLQIKELLDENRFHDCEGMGRDKICVRIAAIADLPSRFGQFQVVAFWNNRDSKEHAAFVHGDVSKAEGVAVRLHSECLTGDAIGSLRCDCRDQLEAALKDLGQRERTVSCSTCARKDAASACSTRSAHTACRTMAWTRLKPTWPSGSATTNGTTALPRT